MTAFSNYGPERAGSAAQPHHLPAEAFVFRDFEVSKVASIREAIDRSPFMLSVFFFGMVMLWTIMMTAGSRFHGDSPIGLNLMPHVSLYCAAVGLFIYPARLIWVPILTFALTYVYVLIHLQDGMAFLIQTVSANPFAIMILFFMNLGAAIVIAMILRLFFAQIQYRMRPHLADLVLCLASYFVFIAVCAVQLWLTIEFAETLSSLHREQMGYDGTFVEFALYRIFRGGVVLAGFLLAAIEHPNQRNTVFGLGLAILFPALAVVQQAGLALYPMLDTAMFAILIMILFPVPIAIIACIVGTSIYAALTGHFLNDTVPQNDAERSLLYFSIFALFLLVVLAAFRSRSMQVIRTLSDSMRRLHRVRGFAGVGLFSANLTQDRYRIDMPAALLLNLPQEGKLAHFLHAFDLSSRDSLTEALNRRSGEGKTLLLNILDNRQRPLVVRLLIWSEVAQSGNDVSYGLLVDETSDAERNQALEDALNSLSNKEERQRQLFSIISHEVRTPAATVSMLIDELPETPKTVGRLRQKLRDSSDHLLNVLGDMRQAVDPEKNLPVEYEVFRPSALAQRIIDSQSGTAAAQKIALVFETHDVADQDRIGDTRRIRQVLTNLVRNALVHAQATEVILRFSRDTGPDGTPMSVWTVEDNGRGITEDEAQRLFEPFQRGAAPSGVRADGSGLGLFIARTALNVLGGTITFRCAPSGGALFEVTIPDPDIAYASDRPIEKNALTEDDLKSMSVLIAEDTTMVAEVLRARLSRVFGSVRLVPDGPELVEEWLRQPADLILSDLFMPKMNGDIAAKSLRQLGCNTLIIGLTAAAVEAEAERFTAAGADAVMFKPLDLTELQQTMARLMHEKRA